MTATVLGVAWGAFLLAVWRSRSAPLPRRVRASLGGSQVGSALPNRAGDAAEWLGRVALRLAAAAAGTGAPAASPVLARRVGWGLVAGLAVLAVAPPAAPGTALLVGLVPSWRDRRSAGRRAAAVERALPDAVDLLVLGVEAGLNVHLALGALARRGPEPLAGEIARLLAEAGRGRRLADALDELPVRLGESVRPLVAALGATERYGAPLREGLERLAADVRRARRRRAEEAARRVPVKLLFPLVFCTLPAFALLTVAPLLAGAFGSLGL